MWTRLPSGSAALLRSTKLLFRFVKGAITGLIGPNGAGKTTLFTVIAGFEAPTAGSVHFLDRDITGLEPHVLAELGIARTFQIVQPFAGLDVRGNIAVGAYLRHKGREDAFRVAEEVGTRVGLKDLLDRPASALTVAGRKRLELARALATEPQLLLLDEVLAGLNPSEIRDMIPVVQGIRASGVTILMVEHVMQAVMSLCDEVNVHRTRRDDCAGHPGRGGARSRSHRGLSWQGCRRHACVVRPAHGLSVSGPSTAWIWAGVPVLRGISLDGRGVARSLRFWAPMVLARPH